LHINLESHANFIDDMRNFLAEIARAEYITTLIQPELRLVCAPAR
jgi:hypothetical protein